MSIVAVNSITDASGGNTVSINGYSPTESNMAGRNAIINGNFDIWQRGTSGTTGYVADRWITNLVVSTAAFSRQSFALGQTDVPNEPVYFSRNVITSVSGSSNRARYIQPIEGVRTFAGQTVTLSFWAKADASKDIAVELAQIFGSGGSPSTAVTAIGVTTCSLTTSWQKFTVTASVPSISGKTLGTDNNDYISVLFWFDAGSDYNARTNSLGQQSGTFDIAQVQLEAGSVATPFERRPVGTELALCQRYYCETIANARFIAAANNHFVNVSVYWPVRMRSNPSVSRSGSSTNTSSVSLHDPSVDGLRFEIVSAAAGDCRAINQTIKADSEL